MAETLTPLYDPKKGTMRVAAFMSTKSGSNLIKLIEREDHYRIAVIFTDNYDSNAAKIGKDFDKPVIVRDRKGFYKKRGADLKDMKVRYEYDADNIHVLSAYQCPVAAYAGYMSIASPILVNTFLGVNVHPADLSLVDSSGKRKYTGDHAVLDAIVAGEKEIRSSTHLVTEQVDGGPIFIISPAVPVGYDIPSDQSGRKSIANDYQDLLKNKGDKVIFPLTLEYIALGRFAKDSQGRLYFDGQPIPNGLRMAA